jgi:Spy/CpxP family protein refolding chaperone
MKTSLLLLILTVGASVNSAYAQATRSIMQESDERINMIPTPEQRPIYAQVEREMRAQMKARRAQGSVAP